MKQVNATFINAPDAVVKETTMMGAKTMLKNHLVANASSADDGTPILACPRRTCARRAEFAAAGGGLGFRNLKGFKIHLNSSEECQQAFDHMAARMFKQ